VVAGRVDRLEREADLRAPRQAGDGDAEPARAEGLDPEPVAAAAIPPATSAPVGARAMAFTLGDALRFSGAASVRTIASSVLLAFS
jgi:hypothetical protein